MDDNETETFHPGGFPELEDAEFPGGHAHPSGDRRLLKAGKSKFALKFKLYAVLHGRLSSGSNELASLIMMEVETLGEGITELMFSMQFSSLRQGEPEILDIMPYRDSDFAPGGLWQLGRENHSHLDRGSNQIVGTISFQGRGFGGPNTVTWRAYGSPLRPILRPAVLLRRNSLERFQASCKVEIIADRIWGRSVFRSPQRDDLVLFDPAISPPLKTPSMLLDNLQEFMRNIQKTGQDSAAVLLKLDEESQRCLVGLSPSNMNRQLRYYVTSLQEALLPASNKWIRTDPAYQRFLSGDGSSSRMLWIRGRPGQGKTMLAAFLVQELRCSLSASSGAGAEREGAIAYFFCLPNGQEISAVTVLRSLIQQVILQLPDTIKHLVQIFKEPEAGEKTFSDLGLLVRAVEKIILDPNLHIAYFIVDGLEHCGDEFLGILKKLGSNESLSSPPLHRKDKWILASRNDPTVEEALPGVMSIDLNANPDAGLEEYIRLSVDTLDRGEGFQNRLKGLLMDKAGGLFVWVSFAIDVIRRHPTSDIDTLRGLLPASLPDLYDQIFGNLLSVADATANRIIRDVLPIVTVAYASLPVLALELWSDDILGKHANGEKNIANQISDALGPFVEIRDNEVRLAHVSVKEYLVSQKGLGHFQGDDFKGDYVGDIHKRVSRSCLSYISHAFADPMKKASDIHEYPIVYWMDHGRQSSQTQEEVGGLVDCDPFFEKESDTRNHWLAMYWRLKHGAGETQPTNFTLMHMAAESGYRQLAEALIRRPEYAANLDTLDGSERAPLHWAVMNGHLDVTRVLLEAGANMRSRTTVQPSVLKIAIQAGRKDIVQLLLGKGFDTDMETLPAAGSDINGLLLENVRLNRILKPKNVSVDHQFWGKLVDVGLSGSHYSKSVPMDRIIDPQSNFDELMGDGRAGNIPQMTLPAAEARHPPSDGALLLMPYLHWGMNRERVMLKNTLQLIRSRDRDKSLPGPTLLADPDYRRYQELLTTYLDQHHPLHTRRTLDEFYYFNLEAREMDARDKSQTFSDYFRKNPKVNNGEPNFPILMVDQLWLWVLDNKTVISSFPCRWDYENLCDPHNMTDIVAAVERRLVIDRQLRPVENGMQLAELIANECSGILFDIAKYREKWLQVREIYESAIGDVVSFPVLSRQFYQTSATLTNSTATPYYYQTHTESKLFQEFSSSLKKEGKWDAKGGGEERYGIGKEVGLLEKVKDIRDELKIIRAVFETQKMVQEEPAVFPTLLFMVKKRLKDLERIDQQALEAQEALKHILDLKQKQANAEEAHFLNVQNIESAKQGQAIMTFTVVTIIFAPLSFLTSFFTVQITEFPQLTLGFVLGIIFPITAFVVIICVVLAFFNVLKDWWQKLRDKKNSKSKSDGSV
ncbi:hypothetical protein QBC44DRAFT_382394 [Cladorrhinum sp. PSN332]|nr:hypothetical protein QBC44DRAFT_382394 [Cladorrhinum sp. PSN332]